MVKLPMMTPLTSVSGYTVYNLMGEDPFTSVIGYAMLRMKILFRDGFFF